MLKSDIKLPENWHMVEVDTNLNLYFNIEQKVATLAPVFHLQQTRLVLE